mmetsp:Transcript_62459/g.140829  ORF Transcript_62459/g.140829 Transcript_62459/m.140829 type:complete len:93 (+) Transcript_62459:855-1133(+)
MALPDDNAEKHDQSHKIVEQTGKLKCADHRPSGLRIEGANLHGNKQVMPSNTDTLGEQVCCFMLHQVPVLLLEGCGGTPHEEDNIQDQHKQA